MVYEKVKQVADEKKIRISALEKKQGLGMELLVSGENQIQGLKA